MTKRGASKGISKKVVPGAVRITNAQGLRVWRLGDKEFDTFRNMAIALADDAKKMMEEKRDAQKILEQILEKKQEAVETGEPVIVASTVPGLTVQ